MNLFYFSGVLWLICWYIYFFTSDDFPYKKQIVYIALTLITILPFKANFLGVKCTIYLLIFCLTFLYCFLKSSFFMQLSLIASFLIVNMIHFVLYLTSIVNPKMFFGFQNIFEILTILIVLTMYLKKPFAIFATASTGIAVSEVLIRIFIDNTYGISIEQIDSGFSLIAGITLFAFVQFIMKSKGKRSSRRIFL